MEGGEQIRVALLGCGAVARDQHAPAVARHPRARLAAVCDVDPERARALASRFGAKAFRDPAALLAAGGADAVFVLTRPDSHAALAEQALQAGAHVLVEKPFVTTTAEADRLLEVAGRVGRRLSVVHNYLFHPAVEELTGRIRAGEIGEICSLHFLHGRRDQRFVPDPWYFESPGGRLAETLPHALYLLTPLLPGLEVCHVRARRLGHIQTPCFDGDLDPGFDEIHVGLEAPDGTWASILYSFNVEVPQSLVAAGTGGTLQAWLTSVPRVSRWRDGAPGGRALLRESAAWLRHRPALGRLLRTPPRRSSLERLVHDFLDALVEGREPRVGGREAREVVRLWEATLRGYVPSS